MLQRLKQDTEAMNIMASLGALVIYTLAFVVLPDFALAADAVNAQSAIKSVQKQTWGGGATVNLISIIFYIIGITLIGKGLLNAKKQSEGGQGAGLAGWLPIFGPLAVGALMIALPMFTNIIWASMGLDPEQSLTAADLDPSRLDCASATAGAATTIGSAICRVYTQVGGTENYNLFSLLNAIAIIVGILTVGSALTGAYKLSTGGQGAPKISGIVWRALGGACLIALPAAVQLVRQTVFEDPTASANFLFSRFEVATDPGIDRALTFFIDNIKAPVINITFFIFIFIGAAIIAKTLYAMSGINFEQQKMTPTTMISRLLIGGCLVSSWSIYMTVATTLMGGEPPDAAAHSIAYSSEALDTVTAGQVNNIFNAALVWVQIVGMIAFFRGFLVLKTSLDGQGQGSISAGMTHIIAGALCINIPWTLKLIQNTIPGISIIET